MGPFNSHQPGTRYSYRYKTLTTLDDRRTATGEANAKVSLAADVDAEAVWLRNVGDQKLIRFEVCSNTDSTHHSLFANIVKYIKNGPFPGNPVTLFPGPTTTTRYISAVL